MQFALFRNGLNFCASVPATEQSIELITVAASNGDGLVFTHSSLALPQPKTMDVAVEKLNDAMLVIGKCLLWSAAAASCTETKQKYYAKDLIAYDAANTR